MFFFFDSIPLLWKSAYPTKVNPGTGPSSQLARTTEYVNYSQIPQEERRCLCAIVPCLWDSRRREIPRTPPIESPNVTSDRRFSFGYEITSVHPLWGWRRRWTSSARDSEALSSDVGPGVTSVTFRSARRDSQQHRGQPPGVVTLPPIARGALAIYVMHRSP